MRVHLKSALACLAMAAAAALPASLSFTGPAVAAEPLQAPPPIQRVRPPLEPDLAAAPVGPEPYRIGRGDRVRIQVYGRDDLTNDYRVSDVGHLRIPQVGQFEALEKTPTELENDVKVALERLTQRPAFLSLDIVERRPFYVVGLLARPGAYPYVPGMTVLHAVALAGGLYRSSSGGSWQMAELTRETYRQQQSRDDVKRLVAIRARLLAERDGKAKIETPVELVKLIGAQAAEVAIKTESEALARQWATIETDEASHRITIKLLRDEIKALNSEMEQIAKQRAIRDKQLDELKSLAGKGLAQNKNLYETQMAISLLDKDSQGAIAGISRAHRSIEKTERDLAMLRLERNVKIDKELEKVEEDLVRSRTTFEGSRRIADQLAGAPGNSRSLEIEEPTLDFEIMRRDAKGAIVYVEAIETTPVRPGDVVRVTPRVGK